MRRPALPHLASFVLAGVLGACSGAGYPPPPETRVEAVTDTIHGIAFTDPYRWLEDQDAPETRAWIAAQNAYAEEVVGPSPLRDSIAARYRRLVDLPDIGPVRRAGNQEYFGLRRPGEELAAIYRRTSVDGEDEPTPEGAYESILDPAALDPAHRTLVSLAELSPDGSILMYQVREGGSDEVEVRFMDTRTLQDLPDRLPRALYGGVRFVDGARAIEYIHRSRESGPRLRRHVFGSDPSEDETLWGDGYGPTTFIGVEEVDDGRWRILTARNGWARGDVFVQERGGQVRPVVVGVDAHFDPEYREGALWITTDWQAPRARLVRVDLQNPDTSAWETVIPEADLPLDDVSFIDGRIYARYIDDVAHRIRIHEMDGRPAGEIEVPPHSSVSVADHDEEGKLSLTVESYLQPEVEYVVDLATGTRTITDSSDVPWDGSGYQLEQVWATSADGTRVPVYVMHRRGIEPDGSHPTILTGYGGFDVAGMPGFSTTAATWMQMGGVWAVATLRGGSEYGETWHRGGMLENKQRVFDDFIAASERLVELGYTSPQRLGIWGASNGGLLVAAALTQRPELYRAVYCGYPDLDMLRFNTFTDTNNMPALLEYGDASVRSQFEAIRQYSPYQAVEDGVSYPAVMLTTGDLDTRVPPLQARKMAARLQAATASGLPVVLWYDERGGHAANRGRPLSLQVEDAARELAFMAEQLGLAPSWVEQTNARPPVVLVPVQPELFGTGGTLTDAWADFDADGDPDRFVGFNGAASRLYRNDRPTGFVDVAADLGIVVERAVRTSAWGDYDADGDPDLLLGYAGDAPVTALFRNDGGAGFRNVAAELGLELAEGATRQASWIDYDRDGDLDLFLALRDRANRLFRNDGANGFADVTEATGIGDPRRTVGAVWLDGDQDGDLDLVAANMDGDANAVWRNDGGTFVDVAADGPVAAGGRALGDASQGSVRVCAADVHTDGVFDLFFANYGPNALLPGRRPGVWERGSAADGLSVPSRYDTCAWGDFDNDGSLDLYVNGTVGGGVHYRDHLYRREGGAHFVDVTPDALLGLNASHGASWVDFDLDGDLDLALAGSADDAMHHLLENGLPADRASRSLQVRVLDERGRATRPGAEVRVRTAGTDRLLGTRLVDTGSGYDAQSDLPVHFGLPDAGPVDVEVTVLGPDGRRSGIVERIDPEAYRGRVLTLHVDDAGRIVIR